MPLIDSATLALFLTATLALFLSPGPNMAFVLSAAVADGPRGGIAAALGIAAADLVLAALTATGVVALIAAWPPSFDLLRYGGALYLLWMALKAWTATGRAGPATAALPTPFARVFRRALLNCLLNPKALLFFMVFLPQFVVRARGDPAAQVLALGSVLALAGLAFHGVLGACGGRAAALFQRRAGAMRWQRGLQCAVLLALAGRMLLLDRPAPR